MIRSLLLGSALLSLGWDGPSPTLDERASYDTLNLEAGRDADAHVRLALWAESRGFADLRLDQLKTAIAIKPDHPTAHGLLGQIAVRGEWVSTDKAIDRAKVSADRLDTLGRYNQRRERIADTPQAHAQLAAWSEQEGLAAEAQVHLRAVVRLDPNRDEAWKKLGARKQGGRWVTPDRLLVEKADADARRKAESHWKPLLTKWKTGLKQDSRKHESEKALGEVTDPGAVASILKIFGSGTADEQAIAVRLLGQIDAPSASRGLAWMAVFGPNDAIRRSSAESLAGRDPRECAEWLIALLRDPIKFEVKPVGGPGSPGELYVQGKRINNRQFYSAPAPMIDFRPGDTLAFDENGFMVVRRTVGYATMPLAAAVDPAYRGAPDLTGAGPKLEHAGLGAEGLRLGKQLEQNQQNNAAMGAEIGSVSRSSSNSYQMPLQADLPLEQMVRASRQQAAMSAARLEADVETLKRYNSEVNQGNARALLALKLISGETREPTVDSWKKWWVELEETSKIAPQRIVPVDLDPSKTLATLGTKSQLPSFVQGTVVWTELGLRPIEEVHAGDLILTRDPTTGTLAFRAVDSTCRIDPGQVRKVRFDGESLVATDLQRFWVAGRGWVMLGDLKADDRVRTVDGVVKVVAIEEPRGPQPSYQVQVGDARGIFVGEKGMMVHDDLVNHPVAHPFDAVSHSGRPD